jgi:hypothetical protein
MKELSQNTTLKEEKEEGTESIAQQIKEIACLNECSGHGACVNGIIVVKCPTMNNLYIFPIKPSTWYF